MAVESYYVATTSANGAKDSKVIEADILSAQIVSEEVRLLVGEISALELAIEHGQLEAARILKERQEEEEMMVVLLLATL
ncbi:MAG: hypothetical protein JKY88_02805 [Pseudomonadales bacterium]|nr:hypothetical protein [Pseudomonadales bacterium]